MEDFRSELYTLGRAIWDYQEGRAGAINDVVRELERVGKGVVKAWKGLVLPSDSPGMLVAACVSHLTLRKLVADPDEVVVEVEGTSLIDQIDLAKQDSYSYAVAHMTEYLRNRHKPKA